MARLIELGWRWLAWASRADRRNDRRPPTRWAICGNWKPRMWIRKTGKSWSWWWHQAVVHWHDFKYLNVNANPARRHHFFSSISSSSDEYTLNVYEVTPGETNTVIWIDISHYNTYIGFDEWVVYFFRIKLILVPSFICVFLKLINSNMYSKNIIILLDFDFPIPSELKYDTNNFSYSLHNL